ncbi:helix-turn-helix domain-containing protein [Lactobacillus gasseri]|uniref:Helix-turn-helix domain-containing protein n=1 Tax=Lactobacillus gasseri TaxID=1596 RepID=A0AB33C4M5_LACGS|nr:helix-turn-helix domain-containing protein [Lactobacillus gasseri]ART99187.1 helix-turn-helix domain-containing protein [Lactobacillus gasseri]
MAKLKDHPISELTIMIESKYGSVIKCPDDDPMLIKLHKLTSKTLNSSNRSNALKRKVPNGSTFEKKQALTLALQGYTDTEIGNKLKINRSTVRNWLANLTDRPAKFTRIIVSKHTGNRIYFPTSKGVREWCDQIGHKFLAVNRGYDQLFSMQQIEVHWHELPIGAIYQSAQQNKFYVKENNDNYARGEQYYF